MVNPQTILQMAMQRCNDPKMRSIIQNNINNPTAAIQELCKQQLVFFLQQTIDHNSYTL